MSFRVFLDEAAWEGKANDGGTARRRVEGNAMKPGLGLGLALLAAGTVGSCLTSTEPADLSAAVDVQEIVDGVVAYLFVEKDSIGLGEPLAVELRVQNHRRETVTLASGSTNIGVAQTYFEGEFLALAGVVIGELPSATPHAIGPGRAYVRTWVLVAEEEHPRGHYELRVGDGVEVDPDDAWHAFDLKASVVVHD